MQKSDEHPELSKILGLNNLKGSCERKEEKEEETAIVIHVLDPLQKKTKDFKCKKEILLREMKYFEKYTGSDDPETTLEDLDISVQCQIDIFEWLMNYVHHVHSHPRGEDARSKMEQAWATARPKLEVRNVISILISAEFLKMPKLIEESIRFVVEHLQEIVQLPIDLNCLSSSMAKKLAKHIPLDDLEKLKDKKDRLQSRLYKKKLEIYFEDEANML